jgi:hypothetical protein
LDPGNFRLTFFRIPRTILLYLQFRPSYGSAGMICHGAGARSMGSQLNPALLQKNVKNRWLVSI